MNTPQPSASPTAMPKATRLMVTGISKAYPGLTVLKELALAVNAGEVVAIRGASGTGKSTLLHCLGLLDLPGGGSIRLDGDELTALGDDARARARARRIGFVFQAFHLLPEFSLLENVLMTARTAGLHCGRAVNRVGRFHVFNALNSFSPSSSSKVFRADHKTHPPHVPSTD